MNSQIIVFISKSLDSPSTRYRASQYFPLLQEQDYKPQHAIFSGGIRAYFNTFKLIKQADIVVVIRKTFPFLLVILLRLTSKKLIFDLDDAIFCKSDGSNSKTRMKYFKHMTKFSDHIFAGNLSLTKQSLKFNQAVTNIPTSLDVAKYNLSVKKSDKHIDLVWIGSRSTSKYLLDILPALEQAVKNDPRLRLKIIADFELTDTNIPALNIPWSEQSEALELVSSHIGLAPMPDNNWTRGKCALKILQYMAAGLPVVSSDVGVNSEAVIDNESGYLVTSPKQWVEKICLLAADKSMCAEMGTSGKKRVTDYYDIQIVFNKILTVLENNQPTD